MSHGHRRVSRRAFLGGAVLGGATAVTVAVVAEEQAGAHPAAWSGATAGSAPPRPGQPAAARPRPVPESARPGDPHWEIRQLGRPDGIMGYAGRDSVLPGEPVPLYVSTTARSFRVLAFRMGWYRGDLARLVWRSPPIRGHRQRRPSVEGATRTVSTRWAPSLTVPTEGWPAGAYLLRLDAESGPQRYVPLTVRSASAAGDRKSTRLNSSHMSISYAVFCLKKKNHFTIPYRYEADCQLPAVRDTTQGSYQDPLPATAYWWRRPVPHHRARYLLD